MVKNLMGKCHFHASVDDKRRVESNWNSVSPQIHWKIWSTLATKNWQKWFTYSPDWIQSAHSTLWFFAISSTSSSISNIGESLFMLKSLVKTNRTQSVPRTFLHFFPIEQHYTEWIVANLFCTGPWSTAVRRQYMALPTMSDIGTGPNVRLSYASCHLIHEREGVKERNFLLLWWRLQHLSNHHTIHNTPKITLTNCP